MVRVSCRTVRCLSTASWRATDSHSPCFQQVERAFPSRSTAAPAHDRRRQVNGAVAVIRICHASTRLTSSNRHSCRRCPTGARTPLTMIRGFSELLLSRNDLDATRSKKALEHISESFQRLGRLIEDLLSVRGSSRVGWARRFAASSSRRGRGRGARELHL